MKLPECLKMSMYVMTFTEHTTRKVKDDIGRHR